MESSSSSSVALKLYLPNGVISRIELPAGQGLYAALCARITADHHHLTPPPTTGNSHSSSGKPGFVIRYQDDERDFCVVTSEQEMAECVRVSARASSASSAAGSSAPLKLWVTVPAADGALGPNPVPVASPVLPVSKPAVPASAVPPLEPVSSAAAPNAKSAPAPSAASSSAAAASSSAVVHPNSRCAQCGVAPVVGVRYRCLTCSAAVDGGGAGTAAAVVVDYCSGCEATHNPQHVLVRHAAAVANEDTTAVAAAASGNELYFSLAAGVVANEEFGASSAATASVSTSTADVKQPLADTSTTTTTSDKPKPTPRTPQCKCSRLVRHTNVCTCFDARFVCDLTLLPAERVARGAVVTKRWRLRNPHSDRGGGGMCWPPTTRLVMVGGEGKVIAAGVVLPSEAADTKADATASAAAVAAATAKQQHLTESTTVQCPPRQTVEVAATVKLPAASAEPSARVFFRLAYTDALVAGDAGVTAAPGDVKAAAPAVDRNAPPPAAATTAAAADPQQLVLFGDRFWLDNEWVVPASSVLKSLEPVIKPTA